MSKTTYTLSNAPECAKYYRKRNHEAFQDEKYVGDFDLCHTCYQKTDNKNDFYEEVFYTNESVLIDHPICKKCNTQIRLLTYVHCSGEDYELL